tara:strand:- start:650 stop:1279 length:630 start_codon:yes stop_codon:yes gene_type:complete
MGIYDDVIKKMIFGMPKTAKQAATRGLLGRGGEYGDGKLRGLLDAPNVRRGLGLISSGFRGRGLQDAMLKEAQLTRARALENLLKRSDLSDLDRAYLAAGIRPPRRSKLTVSEEALNIYGKLKGKSGKEFENAYGNLSQAEKDIYNKVIKGNESILSQVLKKDPQINRSRRKKDKVKKVPEKKNELIDGQEYEVNGKILKWNKANNRFE